ncbi:MAG TPA: hypothetical protein VK698_32165 [Kofleriaceae bacterium]|nr:hypothetical protein [Kofleriaceae bacterium]
MAERGYRQFLRRRREERAYRRRWERLVAAGIAPVLDDPMELAPEQICVNTGELLDRRAASRRGPTR